MSARRLHDIVCITTLVFLIAYVLPLFGVGPTLWYVPLEDQWVLGAKPAKLVMDWYGRTLFAILVAGIAAIATTQLTRTRALGRPRVWAGLLAVALAIAMGTYVEHLEDRVPVPEPLPSGYVPR